MKKILWFVVLSLLVAGCSQSVTPPPTTAPVTPTAVPTQDYLYYSIVDWDNGNADITGTYRLQPETGVVETVLPKPNRVAVRHNQLLYVAPAGGQYDDIFVANPDGTDPVNLTNTPFYSEWYPDWTPSGQSYGYINMSSLCLTDFGGGNWCMSLNAAGPPFNSTSTPWLVVPGHGDYFPNWEGARPQTQYFSFGPDDRTIVISTTVLKNGDQPFLDDLYLLLLGDAGIESLEYLGPGYGATFSPDGQTLAFQYQPEPFGPTEFYLMDFASRQVTQVISGEIYGYEWSPDSQTLAFEYVDEQGASALYLVDSDGSNLRSVVDGWFSSFTWSPDNQTIAYVPRDVTSAVHPNTFDILAVDLATGETRLLQHITVPADAFFDVYLNTWADVR